jgi:hypothetical protein
MEGAQPMSHHLPKEKKGDAKDTKKTGSTTKK